MVSTMNAWQQYLANRSLIVPSTINTTMYSTHIQSLFKPWYARMWHVMQPPWMARWKNRRARVRSAGTPWPPPRSLHLAPGKRTGNGGKRMREWGIRVHRSKMTFFLDGKWVANFTLNRIAGYNYISSAFACQSDAPSYPPCTKKIKIKISAEPLRP